MSNSETSDVKILNALRLGNKDAFEVIFRKYNARIYNFALATLYEKNLAEDITQNVFLSVWEHRKNIIPEKNFSAYLFTVAKNLIYRETEKMLLTFKYESHFKSQFNELDYSSEEKIDADSLTGLILQLIEKLPEARKKVFLLHFNENLKNREIATKLSISEENVETQLKRSLDFIRKQLKNHINIMTWFYL
ncbi:MAG: RNA polymerase sigma-70 factor [Dysgonamonadaceae bacterium]|jgi:RNA polymerase sigma-70 factor (ECF subfamily)|nr:RNA polymerase sigma-70 factor [Dysgonamonadaceae bacterium]